MNLLSPRFQRCMMLLILCAAWPAAHALDCANAKTQGEMNACAGQDLAAADAELNKTYVALRAQLDAKHQAQIRDVQLAWIKYRDLSCRFESSAVAGGTAEPMVRTSCLAEKTRQRTQELKAMGSCQEYDLSCVRR